MEKLGLKPSTEVKTNEYLKKIEYNTRSAKNTLMFIRVLYIIALSIGGLILIGQLGMKTSKTQRVRPNYEAIISDFELSKQDLKDRNEVLKQRNKDMIEANTYLK